MINATPTRKSQVVLLPAPVNAREPEVAVTGVVGGNELPAVNGPTVVDGVVEVVVLVDEVVEVVDGVVDAVVVVDGVVVLVVVVLA
jgi:hypothetical protein